MNYDAIHRAQQQHRAKHASREGRYCEKCGVRYWPAQVKDTGKGALCVGGGTKGCLELVCRMCDGTGVVFVGGERDGGQSAREEQCPECGGDGWAPAQSDRVENQR